MNLKIEIIKETCEWFGENPCDFYNESVSGLSNSFCLSCFLLRNKIQPRMGVEHITKYFSVMPQQVFDALQQHEQRLSNNSVYRFAYNKMMAYVEQLLIETYSI